MSDEIKVFVTSRSDRPCVYLVAKRGRKRVASKSAETTRRREAERSAANWERELRDANNPDRGRAMDWETFTERYLDAREGKVATATIERDEITFRAFERVVGPMRPVEITTEHVDQFAAGLRDEGKRVATINRHLRHLKAALRWGNKRRIVREVPSFEIRGGQTAKGRPLTGEEFDRLLDAVPGVVGDDKAASWRLLLRGLWSTGLRVSEAVDLHWADERRVHVDETGRHAVLVFPPDRQKNRKADVVPCTPEFVELVTDADRRGFVFNPEPLRGSRRLTSPQVSRIVSKIGKAARIVVKASESDEDEQPTFASAHDLRRTFCDRWSRLVTPAVLTKLARHGHITTTMQFYVGHDAQSVGDAMLAAVAASGPPCGPPLATDDIPENAGSR